nr:MAG TPA: hypothetical protein [Caudoviricetes sp.]
MRTESQKRANEKYRQKCKTVQIVIYPTDKDIEEKLNSVPSKATYIKTLIRDDIQNSDKSN